MSIVALRVGIDVSKRELVAAKLDKGKAGRRSFPNEEAGHAALIQWLGEPCLVSMESSGGYERACRRALEGAGHQVLVHNPRRVRRLAQALGVDAKTDALDAGVLCRASELGSPAGSRSREQEALLEVSRAVEQLKEERAQHLKRLRGPLEQPAVRAALERVCELLAGQVRALEREFARLLQGSGELKERFELAKSVPSVGEAMARNLVAELPLDLRPFHPRQVASYAGLAPKDDASGQRTGRKHVRGGNKRLKASLYMPAMNAIGTQAWAKGLYARLRAGGKTHQQAIVPVMRKLLLIALAVMRRGSAWTAEPQKT